MRKEDTGGSQSQSHGDRPRHGAITPPVVFALPLMSDDRLHEVAGDFGFYRYAAEDPLLAAGTKSRVDHISTGFQLDRASFHAVFIRELVMHGELQSRGIGAELVSIPEDEAEKRGCNSIEVTTRVMRVDAQRFYEHRGFLATYMSFTKVLTPRGIR